MSLVYSDQTVLLVKLKIKTYEKSNLSLSFIFGYGL